MENEAFDVHAFVDECIEKALLKVTDALVLDTETTSFNGTVIQLGYVLMDSDGREIGCRARYLRLLPGETISSRAMEVHHIDEQMLDTRGEDAKTVLDEFHDACDAVLQSGGVLVAHNAAFDVARLAHTARMAGSKLELLREDVVCTQALGAALGLFTDRNGRRKRPRNDELYEALVEPVPDPEALHDAVADARLTGLSFYAGRARGSW